MHSKRYCPECGSFDIKRVHRGFLKKVILKRAPRYRCRACDNLFSSKDMRANTLVDDPFSLVLQ